MFVQEILREYEGSRAAGGRPARGTNDAGESDLVALAAMASRWYLQPRAFEAKLERLCRTPTGAASLAAVRMLALWRAQCREGGDFVAQAGSPGRHSETRATTDPTSADTVHQPTILVIDDDPDAVELVRYILRDRYEVHVVSTAGEALPAARRLRPDAIVLDLILPDGHGARVLADLKADPQTVDIGVVITSSYTAGLRGADRALADRVVRKPFHPIELLAAVETCLRRAG